MVTETEQTASTPARLRDAAAKIPGWALVAGVLAVSLVILQVAGAEQTFPGFLTGNFPFIDGVNQAEDWLQKNYAWATRGISKAVGDVLSAMEEFLWQVPWPVVLVGFTVPALAFGGLRLGLLAVVTVMMWGAFDVWFEAMSTLSMMAVAVGLCIVIGIAIGVACAGSDRLWAAISPVLDAMQVMPAFVYLIPAIFFFGIGPAPGTLAVMIYALPPMIRLTNLGLRQVPKTMVEAAESFGTTRSQLLLKVQLPQALPSILLGINQTIMMALALAVLTIFVGSGGLGDPVWNAIRRLRVGASVEAGLCIVMMAILFDRLSYAMSAPAPAPRLAPGEPLFRLLPQAWAFHPLAQAVEARLSAIWWFFSRPAALLIRLGPPWVARHIYLVMGILLIAVIYAWEAVLGGLGSYPRALEFSIREPIDAAVEALTINPAFIAVTKAIRTVTFLYFLKPIDQFLTHLPWWYVTALITGGIYLAAGGRLALLTFLSLIFCGAAGMWEMTMYTITGTAVSVLFCLVLGLPLGILASQIRWVDAVLRPILDTMQTIPSFVYLVPALFFFGGNPTTAVIATVIYAIPPIIRTTTLGLRQIPTEIDEVASAFGTRSWQSLIKVKLPMATPSVMLGVNQTVIMALAMQTVTPIVAGLGLGKEVYDAMNTANTGKGLAAGIGIVLMAIVLDRLSQALTATQRRALGLA